MDEIWTLLLISLFSAFVWSRPCPTGSEFETSRKYCIWVGTMKSSFFLADAECRSHGGYLLIVDNAIHDYLKNSTTLRSKFMHSEVFTWIDGIDFYSPGNFYDRNNNPIQNISTKWETSQPDLTVSNKHCLKANFTGNYLFYNEICDQEYQPLCYIDIGSVCPSNSNTTVFYPPLSLCFWVVSNLVSYDLATLECQFDGNVESDLAKIENAAVNDFLLTTMHQYVTDVQRLWIGFDDKLSDGEYYWLDGSPVIYLNFRGAYPYATKSCGVIFSSDFTWEEYYCIAAVTLKSLCYTDISNVTIPPIDPRSAHTLTTQEVFTTTTVSTTTEHQITTPGNPTTQLSQGSQSTVNQIITSTQYVYTSTESCWCDCNRVGTNMTDEELATKLQQLELALTVEKKSTSSYKRTKISAHDDRASSKSIGYVGIAVLVTVFGSIVLGDIISLFFHVKKQNPAAKVDTTE